MNNFHAQAMNLARRHSIRNENDFLQENILEDEDDRYSMVTEKYCSSLLEKHLPPTYELPAECHKFSGFRTNLQRRQTNREEEERTAAIAFQGMSPHEALEAMRAREHGLPHTAQIKRRMTNPNKSESTWF